MGNFLSFNHEPTRARVKPEPIEPKLPFVWPEPSVSAGVGCYVSNLPFERAIRSAQTVFGVVSAIDSRAIDWMEVFLTDQPESKLRLVVSIHPTCRTTEADLLELLHLLERHGDRVGFKVFPERSLKDRSSNLLCLHGADDTLAISSGPTENLGFAPAAASHANVAMQVTAVAFEGCRKWFDYLWAVAGPLRPEVAMMMPRLMLPEGDQEASRLWDEFRKQCLGQSAAGQGPVRVEVDPESGEVILIDGQGKPIDSPTGEIGAPKLDPLARGVARLFDLGALVSIDKFSRIPPLEAPVKPEWLGVDSFRQTGRVRAQTSIKVAPFDQATLKKIDRLRRVSGELLPRYSFSLANGVRWIPRRAIPLFEAALTAANDDAKQLLRATVGDSIEKFLVSQSGRIRDDAQRMYEAYHPAGRIPEAAVNNILEELRIRLAKTQGGKLIPGVAYSLVAFNPSQCSEWSSPWGQAFALLKGIAEFPRKAMTDRFFWRGIRTDESALINAMDVAGDYLVKVYGSPKAVQQSAIDMDLIKRLEDASGDARDKCRALWAMITAGKCDDDIALIDASVPRSP